MEMMLFMLYAPCRFSCSPLPVCRSYLRFFFLRFLISASVRPVASCALVYPGDADALIVAVIIRLVWLMSALVAADGDATTCPAYSVQGRKNLFWTLRRIIFSRVWRQAASLARRRALRTLTPSSKELRTSTTLKEDKNMTVTINTINITPEYVELTGSDLDFLFAEDYDEQIEEREVTFRFDRSNRGNMVYLNRILSSRHCTQPTMAERINGLLNVTTSISTSFLVRE